LRAIATLLLLAVAVLCGYTYLRVSHFETRIRKLEIAAAKRESGAPGARADTRVLLAQASESCRRAKVYLDRGQTAKAKRELDRSIAKLSQASKSMEGGGDVRDLTEAWDKIKAQMDRLWRQFAKESKQD